MSASLKARRATASCWASTTPVAWSRRAFQPTRCALLYGGNLTRGFFDLSSGEAGAVLQKLRNYGVRLAVVCPAGSVRFSSRFGELLAEERLGQHFAVLETREAARRWLGRAMELVWPAAQYLPAYVAALQQGWSPDNLRPEAALEHLARIAEDQERFLAEQVDREGNGPPVILPDGSTVARLPGYARWIWDGEFCGTINFRWQPGTSELPPYCLGHVGYSVVPWKRQRGYATRALRLLLPQLKDEGLSYIELTTDEDNIPSTRVIENNGGELIERFRKPDTHGGAESLRYRIPLLPAAGR